MSPLRQGSIVVTAFFAAAPLAFGCSTLWGPWVGVAFGLALFGTLITLAQIAEGVLEVQVHFVDALIKAINGPQEPRT